MDIINQITNEFSLQRWQVENTVKLIDEGNTIPFIARYRKEQHGTLDDQVLREISERLEYLRNLEKRREDVFAAIEALEAMTPERQGRPLQEKRDLNPLQMPFPQGKLTANSPLILQKILLTLKKEWKPLQTLYRELWTSSLKISPTMPK